MEVREGAVVLELWNSNPKTAPKANSGDAVLLTMELSRLKGKLEELWKMGLKNLWVIEVGHLQRPFQHYYIVMVMNIKLS